MNIYSALSWKNHITNFSGKLNKACYAIRAIKPFMSQESTKMIYYSYVHLLLSHGIIFCGNAPHNENIFKIWIHAVDCLKNCTYYHYSLNSIFLYFYLLLKIGTILDLMLIFSISIHVSIITYICLPQICQLFKEESFFQAAGFIPPTLKY
jgi:hypothetical protein